MLFFHWLPGKPGLGLGLCKEKKAALEQLRQRTRGHDHEGYLELPHLLELEPEFCHALPHVKQDG
jgi:hypothetical protein